MRVPLKHKHGDAATEDQYDIDIDEAYAEDLRQQGLGDLLDLALEKYASGNYSHWALDNGDPLTNRHIRELGRPLNYMSSWKYSPEEHAKVLQKLQGLKEYYDNNPIDTYDGDKEQYTADLAQLQKELAEHEAIPPEKYSPLRQKTKPYMYAGFDKKGKPKKALDAFYRGLRGSFGARINNKGDLVIPYATMHTDSHDEALIANLVRERAILYDTTADVAIIPAQIVKKIDPYYKEYNKTINAIRDELDEHPEQNVLDYITAVSASDFGRFLSLRALKNLQKSTNLRGAYDEIKNFINDHEVDIRYNEDPNLPYNHRSQFDSLNQVRAVGEQFAARERDEAQRRERARVAEVTTPEQIAEQLMKEGWTNNGGVWLDPNNNEYTEEEAFNVAKDKIVEFRLNAPYEYSKDIQETIGTGEWHLPTSPQDLRDRSDLHNICVGNSRMPYINAIRNHNTLILLKDDATAEINLYTDEDGYITKTYINQVKGNKNKPLPIDPELKAISENLVGKNVQDISEPIDNSEIEDKISDIIMKHNLRPITAAIHRRF